MSKVNSIYSALFDDEVFVMYGLESVEYEINQLQDAPDAYSLQLQLRRVLQALASIGVFIFMNEISENYHFSPRRSTAIAQRSLRRGRLSMPWHRTPPPRPYDLRA
jgi:hypothetical protein